MRTGLTGYVCACEAGMQQTAIAAENIGQAIE